MQNNETYIQAFAEAFEISDTKVIPTLEYQSITNWDSVGHMALISALEDSFDIMMEMGDVFSYLFQLAHMLDVDLDKMWVEHGKKMSHKKYIS